MKSRPARARTAPTVRKQRPEVLKALKALNMAKAVSAVKAAKLAKAAKAAKALEPRAAREKRENRAAASAARLRAENRALRKSVQALMVRVEKTVDRQGSAFSWFQAAASLEEAIRQRTEQYEQLNLRLTEELKSRREIELALKQAKEFADRANETKTRFLAAASHDLRQPLSSALLFLESISEAALTGLDLDYLHKARVALASLSNLLDTLLDVARLDSGGIEPEYADFPVSAVLDRIVPEFGSVARSAGLQLDFVSCSAWVRSDMHLLETVLRNLISNAIRYTMRGRVLIGCRRKREGLLISVLDTGLGIEGEHLEAIFTAYYQVPAGGRARTKGIGLGLSIVERISTLLSLSRVVRSVPGRGSLFAVLVPYGKARGRARSRVAAAAGGARMPSLAIAVIDDDPGVRLGLAATLVKWGHRPIAAATATEAVVQFIGADLSPDFIISDYHLAGSVKGDEAIDEVRREFDRAPPAAIMTSDPDPKLRAAVATQGFTLLAKPIHLAELRALLERIAAQ
jgi:two-component system, sensor histidine kinase